MQAALRHELIRQILDETGLVQRGSLVQYLRYLQLPPGALEPWLDRVADFGALGLVHAGGLRVVGLHRMETTGGGTWSGLRPTGAEPPPEGLSGEETAALVHALRAMGERLRAEGYEGAFGIDAWRVREGGGGTRLHALGELNARLTFGFVAPIAPPPTSNQIKSIVLFIIA